MRNEFRELNHRVLQFVFISLLVTCAAQLASCGFHPVYGVNKYTATGAEEILQQIYISNIPDREGQFLRNELIDRFYRDGRPLEPLYTLDIKNLNESKTHLDVTKDADSTRGQLRLTAQMELRNAKSEILIIRNLSSIASYNVLNSEFTNRVSEQNARENILRDLARQAEQQVVLYLKRQK